MTDDEQQGPAASTALVFAQSPLQARMGWAKAVAAGGELVPKGYRNEDGSANPAKVLIAAEYASTLGLAPIIGLTGINVVEGKPSLSAGLVSALIRRAGHKLRITTRGTVEGGDFAATATLIRADDPDHPYTATWTPQRAQRAGLCTYVLDPKTKQWKVTARSKYDKVLPWEAYTESLCKARAITEVGREGAEDVLFGIAYTAEELGSTQGGDDGGFIDLTPTSRDVTAQQQDEPIDAELVDEQTGEVHSEQPTTGEYHPVEADEWAAQIAATPELGHPTLPHAIESDTLAGLFLRAQRAGVLSHLADDPDRVPEPKTIEQLIADRRDELQAADRARKAGS